jgi:(2Fe-2S) ferredoxin
MSDSKNPTVKKLKHHVFVCLNERPSGHPRGCCRTKGAEEVLQTFKTAVSDAGLKSEVRAQKAGCLDTCEFGVSVVVYPDNVWYGGVTPKDVPEIVRSHLIEGQPVQRLRIPGK